VKENVSKKIREEREPSVKVYSAWENHYKSVAEVNSFMATYIVIVKAYMKFLSQKNRGQF